MATLAIAAGAAPEVSTKPRVAKKSSGLPAEVCRCSNGVLDFAPARDHCVRCGRDRAHSEDERLAACQTDGLRYLDAAIEAERVRLRLEAESVGLEWADVVREYAELTEGGWR